MKPYPVLLAVSLLFITACASAAKAPTPIDRQALVTRHNPVLTKLEPGSPLSVGNGEFCFTADVTGLQTFPEAYSGNDAIPLCTMADWGWHSFPNTQNFSMETYGYKNYDTHGRPVGYADQNSSPASNYLRENPHKFDLGQIGFVLTKADGTPATPADITDINQTLDMWNGVLKSHFKFDGQPVDVQTVCDSASDTVSAHIVSPLLANGRLAVRFAFPYGSPSKTGADWTKPNAHTTKFSTELIGADFGREMDNIKYDISVEKTSGDTMTQKGPHEFLLKPADGSTTLEFSAEFNALTTSRFYVVPDFSLNLKNAQTHWKKFWSTGGAIDLSLSKDPRWQELERRIVLSEYLTAIQSTGKNPPAETGLTMNSWYGKFHMEMYWWHDAHFALWGRAPLLENSMGFYQNALANARANAKRQGYDGARWPKMTDPSGMDSPSSVGAFLIWEQPHPIYLAELLYRAHPDKTTLEKYKDVIFATADFMTSFAWWDATNQRYVLGPPLQEAQEEYPKATMFNPTYELTYWRWALEVAQQWRVRLGLAREDKWDQVLQKLSKPVVSDGKYLFTESTPDSYTDPKWVKDHPAVLNAFGVLPGPGIDPAIMRNTFDWIWKNWDWPSTWGWDYPVMAMSAARLGDGERAVQSLLIDTPKNHYAINGHNFQRGGAGDTSLPLYLPGNGGLLTAVAMMAAGWDGAPKRNAPGFPNDGQWVVRWEGLQPLP